MKKLQKLIAFVSTLAMLASFNMAFASEVPVTDDQTEINAILVGDTDFTFSVAPTIQPFSSIGQEIHIEKYIAVEDVLADGTVVLKMTDETPNYETSLYVDLILEQIYNSGNIYGYSVTLHIGLVGSGNAVKSFSATLDYGDGSNAFNSISFDTVNSWSVDLIYPTKYYNSTTQGGLTPTSWNVSVPGEY